MHIFIMHIYKSLTVLLFVILSIQLSISHPHNDDHGHDFMQSSPINDVIDSHYHANFAPFLKKRNVESTTISGSSTSDNVDKSKLFSYTCAHDSIANGFHTTMKENLAKMVTEPTNQQAPKTRAKRAALEEYAPLRIVTNLTYIIGTNDAGRTCYAVGDVITIGGGTSDVEACALDANGRPNNPPNIACRYTCTAEDIITEELRIVVQHVYQTVFEILSKILSVPRKTLSLNNDIWLATNKLCDYGVTIPDMVVAPRGGVANGDFYAFITIRPESNASLPTHAVGCNFNWDKSGTNRLYGRPLAGTINFSPSYYRQLISVDPSVFVFRAAVRAALHEMFHALGFDPTFYASYLDVNGEPHIATTTKFTYNGRSVANQLFSNVELFFVTTPRVNTWAGSHFNCDRMNGMQLEDFGGENIAGSHWEKRLAGSEIMTGDQNPVMPITGLTFSLFEDMGWYVVDYTMQEQQLWGSQAGCAFVNTTRCETWGANSNSYFCTNGAVTGCAAERLGKGRCNAITYNDDVTPFYQHFSNARLGGNPMADYCAFMAVSDTNPVYCSDESQSGTAIATSTLIETFAKDSLCFDYTSTATQGNVCLQYRCVDNGLQIKVANDYIACVDGFASSTSGSDETVVACPSAAELCHKPTMSSFTPKGRDLTPGANTNQGTSGAEKARDWIIANPIIVGCVGGAIVLLIILIIVIVKVVNKKKSRSKKDKTYVY